MADVNIAVTGVTATARTNGIPLFQTNTAGDIKFTTSVSSTLVEVQNTAHGCVSGDFVDFSNVTFGSGTGYSSLVTQLQNNLEVTVTGVNTFTVNIASASGADIFSSGAADADFMLNKGSVTQLLGTGWGAGAWGDDGWGDAASEAVTLSTQLRLWQQDNFGEDLILLPRNGRLYYWDKTTGFNTRPRSLDSYTSGAPTKSREVLVSDRDRHVIVFGTTPLNSTDLDPLLIRFSDQENPFDWTPTSTNTAGDLRVGSGSEIVQAVETRREIIVLTDTSVHSMQFLGPPFTFGISQIAEGTTIRGINAAVAINDAVFWMGVDRFYLYDGRVQPIPCTVKDHVFNDFDAANSQKVIAGRNSAYGEVVWYYPSESGGTGENDRYVIYNYEEKVWYIGNLARSAWLDRGIYEYPFGATHDTDSVAARQLYTHEFGNDADGAALVAFIDSAPIDISDGEQFSFVRRMIPDVDFSSSDTGATKEATFTLKRRNSPNETFTTTDTFTVTNTSGQKHTRVRARSLGLKVQSNNTGVNWRLGSTRIDIRGDGRR